MMVKQVSGEDVDEYSKYRKTEQGSCTYQICKYKIFEDQQYRLGDGITHQQAEQYIPMVAFADFQDPIETLIDVKNPKETVGHSPIEYFISLCLFDDIACQGHVVNEPRHSMVRD